MRQLLALAMMAFALTTTTAFAQESSTDMTTEATSIKQNMKSANTLFKLIGATLNDPSKNADNAKNAADMIPYFQAAQTMTPDHIHDIPAAQQAAALKGYQDALQKVIDHCAALQQAFLANDNAQAAAIYAEMKKLKSDGHDQYDP